MTADFIVHAIVPARSGSKEFPNKNFAYVREHPLLYWSIKDGIDCEFVDNVYISTDSAEYESYALSAGCLSLGLRPIDLASDLSRDYDYLRFHVHTLMKKSMKVPDAILILRPTSPFRNINDLSNAFNYYLSHINLFDSMRSVTRMKLTPYKSWLYSNVDGSITPLIGSPADDYINSPRQLLPDVFWQNGCFDIVSIKTILAGSHLGSKVCPWFQDNAGLDIDSVDDLKFLIP